MKYSLLFFVFFSLFLGACTIAASPSVTPTTKAIETLAPEATETSQPTATSTPTISEIQPTTPASTAAPSDSQPALADMTRVDDQGAVVIEVTPDNLINPGDTIDFEVALSTHSINLSMDLAKLGTLKTDTGLTANPLAWDGMASGHHVSGTLSFPAKVDGKKPNRECQCPDVGHSKRRRS